MELKTNDVSTASTPSVHGHSALHFLLASRIEPATEEEVEAIKKGDRKRRSLELKKGT